MFNIKGIMCAVFCAVPLILSACAVIYELWVLLPLQIVMLFIATATVPYFRKRETMWMFILVAVSMIPLNIYGAYSLSEFLATGEATAVIWGLILFYVFFSIEEIIFGILSRLIWRKQYKLGI